MMRFFCDLMFAIGKNKTPFRCYVSYFLSNYYNKKRKFISKNEGSCKYDIISQKFIFELLTYINEFFMNALFRIFILTICYLGFAPILCIFPSNRRNNFLYLHIRQSIILWSWLFIISLIIAGFVALLSFLVIYFPDFYQNWDIELWFISITRKIFLCWVVFLIFGFGSTLWNSTNLLPFIISWMRNKWLLGFSKFINTLLIIMLSFICFINVYAYFLLYPRENVPKVYVLYDNLDYLPQCIFNLGFFRIITTGCHVYGKGGVALRVIDKESFAESLKNAEIVFVASHGMEEGMLSRKGIIKPEDVQKMEVNKNLKFVYLSACKSGAQREVWERVLNPAKVLTYKRMTATFEHAWWFWKHAPKVIQGEYKEE